MARKDRYLSHVEPKLNDISRWVLDMTEKQIAERLGITFRTFQRYKLAHPELAAALINGGELLKNDLKDTLKRKARGYYYEEVKTVEELGEDGLMHVVKRETYRKYAQPDTGAAHLLLKNLDETWHNDDVQTMEIKRRQVELTERKIEQNEYV